MVKSSSKTHPPKRYVFKDAEEVTLYLDCLLACSGPVHAVMATLRSMFGARTFQIQNLRRRDVDLGEKHSYIYLCPVKGYDGEWVRLPEAVHNLFRKAAKDGIEVEVHRQCGHRPASNIKLSWKLVGGSEGKGAAMSQDEYIFKAAFSGTYNENCLHL